MCLSGRTCRACCRKTNSTKGRQQCRPGQCDRHRRRTFHSEPSRSQILHRVPLSRFQAVPMDKRARSQLRHGLRRRCNSPNQSDHYCRIRGQSMAQRVGCCSIQDTHHCMSHHRTMASDSLCRPRQAVHTSRRKCHRCRHIARRYRYQTDCI